jgi:hypothetical protein
MRIDRTFKGTLGKSVDLFDDGMCDGPDLQPGKQYLMYTWGSQNGPLPARGCTRSRPVEYADEDLEFLKLYSAGKTTTHIEGTVEFQADDPYAAKTREAGPTPIKNVLVTLSVGRQKFQATTNSTGRFSFAKLPPGRYTISADLSGYRLRWGPGEVSLAANGCVEANLLMKVDRRIQGVVRDEKGSVVSGALVQMVSANQESTRRGLPVLLDVSDKNGNYAIDGIPPGDYYLGVNIESTPTKEHPYLKTYYPNTPDIDRAQRITVVIGASVLDLDLRVPGKLPLVTMHGIIRNADGKPPLATDHPAVRIKEPGLYGQIEQDEIKIDAEGRFEFDLCEGVKYSAFAFSATRPSIYSSPVEFTASKDQKLVLILDKTSEEFQKLRPESK